MKIAASDPVQTSQFSLSRKTCYPVDRTEGQVRPVSSANKICQGKLIRQSQDLRLTGGLLINIQTKH